MREGVCMHVHVSICDYACMCTAHPLHAYLRKIMDDGYPHAHTDKQTHTHLH